MSWGPRREALMLVVGQREREELWARDFIVVSLGNNRCAKDL